ncbi:MAG: GTPase ObgE [uncultured bacterium]|nr:MAG: GTPase ObgE [uncultured bacterium]OGH13309.1 MAG: hypothetical protein A2687_04940 [Candidatus Levybacteria bacterium RIFCSPHIGHO2_01_FULL_38_26]
MLIDEITIKVKAGNGGNGASTFHSTRWQPKGGPDGGNGGNGGSIYFVGINDITSLSQFRYKKEIRAENGIDGKNRKMYGKNASPLIVKVPIGTEITDIHSDTAISVNDEDTKHLIVKGGTGGRGNTEFKSATNQTPTYAEKGEIGEEKTLHLVLKIIADVGLIGLPNAGKSSLLSSITNAHPKIADYPFTTLEPNLGAMSKLIIADIPGLIEGASKGKGLGTSFLKHIQKTKILLHCIDPTSDDIVKDYKTIRKELKDFAKELFEKREMIVVTKADLVDEKRTKEVEKKLKMSNKNLIFTSIFNDQLLSKLKDKIFDLVKV